MNKSLLLLCALLTGCTHPVYIAKECPKPTIPPQSTYPISTLQSGDTIDKVAKAYVITVKMQQNYIKESQIRYGGK